MKRELVITLPDGSPKLGTVVLNGQDISACVQRIEFDIDATTTKRAYARITYVGEVIVRGEMGEIVLTPRGGNSEPIVLTAPETVEA